MRAWRVENAGDPSAVLQLRDDVALPALGPGQLRVRVRAAGVGLPDAHMCRGSYPLTPAHPFTPGQECVGTVLEAGAGSVAMVGARVMAVSGFFLGHGSFAEECIVLDDFALPVPEEMPDVDAAGFVIPYHTAWVGLVRRGGLEAGETLLVLGASGGAGSAAVQLGKALGARVIATAGGATKAEFCRQLGADVVIDHQASDVADAVREATNGRGAEIVYDPVGGEAYDAAARCIAGEGRIVLIGFASGRWGVPNVPDLVARNYSVIGALPNGFGRDVREDAQAAMLSLWRNDRIQVPIHATLPFAAVAEAVGIVDRGEATGKVVVQIEA